MNRDYPQTSDEREISNSRDPRLVSSEVGGSLKIENSANNHSTLQNSNSLKLRPNVPFVPQPGPKYFYSGNNNNQRNSGKVESKLSNPNVLMSKEKEEEIQKLEEQLSALTNSTYNIRLERDALSKETDILLSLMTFNQIEQFQNKKKDLGISNPSSPRSSKDENEIEQLKFQLEDMELERDVYKLKYESLLAGPEREEKNKADHAELHLELASAREQLCQLQRKFDTLAQEKEADRFEYKKIILQNEETTTNFQTKITMLIEESSKQICSLTKQKNLIESEFAQYKKETNLKLQQHQEKIQQLHQQQESKQQQIICTQCDGKIKPNHDSKKRNSRRDSRILQEEHHGKSLISSSDGNLLVVRDDDEDGANNNRVMKHSMSRREADPNNNNKTKKNRQVSDSISSESSGFSDNNSNNNSNNSNNNDHSRSSKTNSKSLSILGSPKSPNRSSEFIKTVGNSSRNSSAAGNIRTSKAFIDKYDSSSTLGPHVSIKERNLPFALSILSPRVSGEWAELPKRVVYHIFKNTFKNGVSNITTVCVNWHRYIETFQNMKCFFSLRMAVEVAQIYKFFVSQSITATNVRIIPNDCPIPFDMPTREEMTTSSEISLSGQKMSFKSLMKKKLILPGGDKKEKEQLSKMQLQFVYPHGLNKIKYTFFIHGVACNCGIIFPAVIKDKIIGKKATFFMEPITVNSILLLQYLYDEYTSNARI